MDFYIISPKMQDRIIDCIESRNTEEFKIKFIDKKNFSLHFFVDNINDINEITAEVKKRMKEDGVAKLIIYQVTDKGY